MTKFTKVDLLDRYHGLVVLCMMHSGGADCSTCSDFDKCKTIGKLIEEHGGGDD